MFPGTIVNWIDQSAIRAPEVNAVDNSPLYLVVSSFDRGPEELNIVSTKFYDLYGSKMNFDKHGQPALQAANMIDNGARLLVKRLVADDAKLASLIAVATVSRHIVATKSDDEDAKTIDEILGNDPVEKEYAELLSIVSTAGTIDNGTTLTVSPEIGAGNSYYWIATEDQTMPILDSEIVTADYTFWDGSSEVAVLDGTKIKLVEVDAENKIKKCAFVEAASKTPHPEQYSAKLDDVTDIPLAVASSKEGAAVGDTTISIDSAILAGNEYFYIDKSLLQALMIGEFGEDRMPTTEDRFTAQLVSTNFAEFGDVLTKDITVEDGKELAFLEFTRNEDDTLSAVSGFIITTCSKLEPDTHSHSSEDYPPIIPTEDRYKVNVEASYGSVKWSAVAIENCLTVNEVHEAANDLLVINDPLIVPEGDNSVIITTSADFPLICMADNGRGLSNKSFKIYSDNTVSKDMDTMYYTANVFDGTEKIEKITISINPNTKHNDTLYGINDESSIQVKMFNVDGAYEQYVELLSDMTPETNHLTPEQLGKYNLITLTNARGEAIPGITYDPESVDFGAAYGVNLAKGSNGAFGDKPFETDAYADQAEKVFEGEFDDAIWDVDMYKIAAIFDANYPKKVKEAIARFVTFREDCVYFRDYGINVDSYAAIMDYHNNEIAPEYKNRYIADYYTTYQIYNPETKKRIKVTMLYDLAAAMVNHFLNGCYRPVAGSANDMILRNAIDGTINFTPRITPKVNQKALLDDARINYAIFENGVCVVQSTYSSQLEFTQLSFINNVLAVQEVIRAIRIACPKTRYTFTTDDDFSFYADAVNAVLINFASHFAQLSFQYEVDPLQAVQKIFYAILEFRFNNWAQTEKFDIYTLGNE